MAAVTADPRAVQGCRVRRLGAMRYLAVAAPDRRDRWFADGLGAEAFAGSARCWRSTGRTACRNASWRPSWGAAR